MAILYSGPKKKIDLELRVVLLESPVEMWPFDILIEISITVAIMLIYKYKIPVPAVHVLFNVTDHE